MKNVKCKMQKAVQFYFLFIWFVVHGCLPSRSLVADELPASALQPVGRSAIHPQHGLELISSAAHFSFSFTGNNCRVFATTNAGGHNYLQYELNGVYQQRLKIEGGSSTPIIITAPNTGRHTVTIYKATEAHTSPIYISKVVGAEVKSLPPAKAPMIEFIGNSITCGAAADPSEVPCGSDFYHDQHNAYMAYGPRVARVLQSNFMLSSISGYGIYRTWNRDEPALPLVYERTRLNTTDTARWVFDKYSPSIVSIALGTNDMSRGDGSVRQPFDSARFVNGYVAFVKLVKAKYPHAQIALLSSPMMNGADRLLLQNCLTAIKKNIDQQYQEDNPVALHFFEPMTPRGCSYHPSVEDHAILADELVPFFRTLLKSTK